MATLTLASSTGRTTFSTVVETFMTSTVQNFAKTSNVTRRRYRTIIPSTTQNLKRFKDKLSVPSATGNQNIQSPQDLPSPTSPRPNTLPVHVHSLEDFENAIMAFMREPLVSLAIPQRPTGSLAKPQRQTNSRPVKRGQQENLVNMDTSYSNHLPDCLRGSAVEDILKKGVADVPDQIVPSVDYETVELMYRTQDFSNTSDEIPSGTFNCDRGKVHHVPVIITKEIKWDSKPENEC